MKKDHLYIFRLSCVFLLLILSSAVLHAQHYEFGLQELQGDEIVVDLSIPILDTDGFSDNSEWISVDPGVLLTVGFDMDLPPYKRMTYKIELEIAPYLSNGLSANRYITSLFIQNNPNASSGTFRNTQAHRIEGAYGANVRVKSISSRDVELDITSDQTPPNVYLRGVFGVERYYAISEEAPHVFVPGVDIVNSNSTTISWEPNPRALNYELEYTWIDNYGPISQDQILSPNDIKQSVRDFELNNTRIITNDTSYEIPLIYSSGYLLYRVRSVSRFLNNISQNFYSQWSSGTGSEEYISDWDYIPVAPHENGMNWMFQASFAEEGKKKEVVNYFDGTLRNRQTVTKINSDDNPIVGEVIYDNQGRPAIEVLPTPVTTDRAIRFYPDYNQNSEGAVYTHNDFDWNPIPSGDPDDIGHSAPVTEAMPSSSGASLYYGPTQETGTFQDFVPDAQEFPFSQIEYTPDNTGRIRRKSGVGVDHKLGTGHEMKYLYGIPSQMELNRLFGYHVGNASHYKRNTVIDPNGQVSISYIDPQGRTIATALSGDRPSNLEGLFEDEDLDDLDANITIDALNKVHQDDPDTEEDNNERFSTGRYGSIKDGLRYSLQLTPTEQLDWDTSYTAGLDEAFTPEDCPVEYSYAFRYICSIIDDCGTPILGPFDLPAGEEKIGTPYEPVSFISTITPVTFPAGTYTSRKELIIDEDILDSYAADYLSRLKDPTSTCFIDPTDYRPQVDITLCNIESCDDCLDALGVRLDYISENLINYFGFPDFIVEEDSDQGIIVSGYEGQSNFEDEVITDAEVTMLVNQFNREFELLTQACLDNCEDLFVASCTLYETLLLSDVSPSGQYGVVEIAQGETELDPLSVFREDNKLVEENSNWRHPSPPYADDFGVPSRIEVIINSDGSYDPEVLENVELMTDGEPDEGPFYVFPQDLAHLADFVNAWNPNWANSLLKYHPEQCYLDYYKSLCSSRFLVSINGESVSINSDTFDSFLSGIDNYLDANDAGLLGPGIVDVTMVNIDPYFSQTPLSVEQGYLSGVSNSTLAEYRRLIMTEGLTSNYDGLMSNGNSLTMLQVAYLIGTCNGLESCEVPSNAIILSELGGTGLSVIEKDAVWNAYKANYRSLKEKIKTVFSNIYAFSQGCYNGCISGGDNSITTPLSAYNIEDLLDLYIGGTDLLDIPQLCDDSTFSEAVVAGDKDERFAAIDNTYNSGISPEDAIAELEGEADYVTWVETGNCPLALDLQLFLQGYFRESTPVNGFLVNPVEGSRDFTSNYLVPDLFEALGGGQTLLDTSISDDILTINTNDSGVSNQIVINSPIDWGNYALADIGNTQWKISQITNIYYDESSALNDPTNGVFAFQFIAQIINGTNHRNGGFEEVIMRGTTHAAIGECGVVDDGVGDVLSDQLSDPDSQSDVGCTRQAEFTRDLRVLFNALIRDEVFNSETPVTLGAYPEYTNSSLPEIFGDDLIDPQAQWSYNLLDTYSIEINDFNVFRTSLLISPFTENFPNFTIDELRLREDEMSSNNVYFLDFYIVDETGRYILPDFTTTLTPSVSVSGERTTFPSLSCCEVPVSVINRDMRQHLAFAFSLTNNGPNNDLENGSRKILGEGVANFINNNIATQLYFTSYDTHSGGARVQPGPDQIPSHIEEVKINSSNEIITSPTTFRFQDNIHGGNLFTDMSNHIIENDVIVRPIDVLCFFIAVDKNLNLDNVRETYQNLIDSQLNGTGVQKIDKVFFVFFESEIPNTINTDQGDLTPFQFINEMIDNPIAYTPDIGVLNSDYTIFDIAQVNNDPNFSSVLSDFLQEAYDPLLAVTNGETSSSPTQVLCESCITQTVAPVPCTAAYADFSDPNTGVESIVLDYTIPESISNNFCNLKYGYLVASYFKYLEDLEVDSIESSYFITIAEFGNTLLNYGYNDIDSVIEAYALFAQQEDAENDTDEDPGNDGDFTPWTIYVNTEYLANNVVCPPAPLPIENLEIIVEGDHCKELLISVEESYQQDSYNNYLDELVAQFKADYINNAMKKVVETATGTYRSREYQYTLYYYDQAGNLVQTVSPKGVKRLDIEQDDLNNSINVHRADGQLQEEPSLLPDHTLETQYRYNSLNQLVWQQTPDGGVTKFAYDDLGRIIASQNARQRSVFENLTIIEDVPDNYEIAGDGTEVTKLTIGDTGAFSEEYMMGNGYVERTITGPINKNVGVSFGLSYANSENVSPNPLRDIEYTFHTVPTLLQGSVLPRMFAHGQNVSFIPSVNNSNAFATVGDVLRIERINGTINYYKNDLLLGSVEESQPSAPLRIDLYIENVGSSVSNINFVDSETGLMSDIGRYSYTTYDEIGRIVEAGEISPRNPYQITEEGRLEKEVNGTFQAVNTFGLNGSLRKEVTRTIYDDEISLPSLNPLDPIMTSGSLFEDYNEFTIRNRVAAVLYFDSISPLGIFQLVDSEFQMADPRFSNGIFYNYDIHGNVKELVNFYPDLYKVNMSRHLKRVTYDYDLISGNVLEVAYQKGFSDQFIHRYGYDADNRITSVETSRDGYIWEEDATYQYYAHGPMARMELGDNKVQGMDYVYTLQGWLKSVNGEYIENPSGDFGKDGLPGSLIAKDAYGFSLNYYDNDYNPVVSGASSGPLGFSQSGDLPHSDKNLYNGNIKEMTTSLRKQENQMLNTQLNRYSYDQLNRIKNMNSTSIVGNIVNNYNSYSSSYEYDPNGNLKSLERNAPHQSTPGVALPMDSLIYTYRENTNQLLRVSDYVEEDPFTSDLEGQLPDVVFDANNLNTHNYVYDELGQLIEDKSEGLRISWRVDGKVDQVNKYTEGLPTTDNELEEKEQIFFDYDGLGNRIAKTVIDSQGEVTTTRYVRDAQGNVLSVLEGESDSQGILNNTFSSFRTKEYHLYGSSRLGIESNLGLLRARSTSNPLRDSDRNRLELDLDPTGYMEWDRGRIQTDLELSNTNYQMRLRMALVDAIPQNDSIKLATLSFTNEITQDDGTVVIEDNYLEAYLKNTAEVYTPTFVHHKAVAGGPLETFTIVSEQGLIQEELTSQLTVLRYSSNFNVTRNRYKASLRFGDRDNIYKVGEGLVFSRKTGSVQDSIPTERPSVLGGEGHIQVRNLNYRFTTETSSIEEEFNFRQQEDNSMPVSETGNVTMRAVTNRIIFQPITFNNSFIRRKYSRIVGDKSYELSNHLGNVLSVVSDKKIPTLTTDGSLTHFNADILAYNDYYPFGMLQPGRHANTSDYRYGFNGMEKDDELKGEGNSYDFGARMLDPRVGRWFARDPLEDKYPNLSTYNYAANMPTLVTDPDGRDIYIFIPGRGKLKGTFVKMDAGTLKSKSLESNKLVQAIKFLNDNDGLEIKYPNEKGSVINILEFFMNDPSKNIVILPNNVRRNTALPNIYRELRSTGVARRFSKERAPNGVRNASVLVGKRFTQIDFDPSSGVIFGINKSTDASQEELYSTINDLNTETGVAYFRDNMGVHSPVLQLAHEILHAFNNFRSADNKDGEFARRRGNRGENKSGIIDGRKFDTEEEQFVLGLMRQVNAKFSAPNPFDHTGLSFPTLKPNSVQTSKKAADITKARIKSGGKTDSSNGNNGHSEHSSKPGRILSPRDF